MDTKTEPIELKVLDKMITEIPFGTYTTYKISLPIPIKTDLKLIGIDPGSHKMGIAIFEKKYAYCHQVIITPDKDTAKRIANFQSMIEFIEPIATGSTLCIEGSAFRSTFQRNLEEVRTILILYSLDYTNDIYVAPPMSIRKTVFGNGRVKAQEQWSGLPNDVLAAISCAYYPYYKGLENGRKIK